MTALSSIPLLSVCIWGPLAGALIVLAGSPRPTSSLRRRCVGVALASLAPVVLAAWSLRSSGPSDLTESVPWIFSRGATYLLVADWLGLALACVAGGALLIAFAWGHVRSRAGAVWMLVTQTGAVGVFLAKDVMLLMSFWGVALFGATMVVASQGGVDRRRVALRLVAVQLLGYFLVLAVFVECYQRLFLETGFVSSDLARWANLMLYPDEQAHLSLMSAVGALCTLPVFPLGWAWRLSSVPSGPRATVLAVAGLSGNYILILLVVELFPRGAATSGTLLLVVGLLTFLAGVAASLRPRARVAQNRLFAFAPLGFQGALLFLIGWGLLFGLGSTPISLS